MSSYSPSPSSLALRSSIASALSGLRRTKPRVPFWSLAAHRIPTLWSLYRGLLRAAPGENWLDYLVQAKQGDARKQKVVARFDRRFGEMKRRSYWRDIYRRELEWIYQMRNRPILTGGFMRPTLFNKLVPRMYRQPIHLSLMIRSRRLARARRLEEQRKWQEWKQDVLRERAFERNLIKFDGLPPQDAIWQTNDWLEPIDAYTEIIQAAYDRDKRRALHIFPKPIVLQVLDARRRRIERKTAEAEKLARGEWVTRWKRIAVRKMPSAGVPRRLLGPQPAVVQAGRRARRVLRKYTNPVHPHRDILHVPLMKRVLVNPRHGAPPPHILQGMSERKRREDQVVRGKSGGGYVGQLRRAKGWKSGVTGNQGLEDERTGEQATRLKKLEDELNQENERRRKLAEERLKGDKVNNRK